MSGGVVNDNRGKEGISGATGVLSPRDLEWIQGIARKVVMRLRSDDVTNATDMVRI